jgi:membrane associated rhomboid family serine protease
MIPLKDTIRSRTFPLVNWIIIGANVLVFLYELSLSPTGLDRFILNYGLVPAKLNINHPSTYITMFTSMFIHGGWVHILSNMWVLFIFGDNVEDRMGSFRYIIFYLLGGIAAGLLQSTLTSDPSIPSIGASGAIAAVLGAYILYFPGAKVLTLIPIFIIPWFVNIPAYIFIGFWFITQLFSGLLSLASVSGISGGGIAWWAHVGGFIFGLLLALPFGIRKSRPTWHSDQYYPW